MFTININQRLEIVVQVAGKECPTGYKLNLVSGPRGSNQLESILIALDEALFDLVSNYLELNFEKVTPNPTPIGQILKQEFLNSLFDKIQNGVSDLVHNKNIVSFSFSPI